MNVVINEVMRAQSRAVISGPRLTLPEGVCIYGVGFLGAWLFQRRLLCCIGVGYCIADSP